MQKMFYNSQEIGLIKSEKKITDYLAQKGYEPTHKSGNEWYYCSIGSSERTPSFRVNVLKNVYQDYSGNQENTGVSGDIIRLVQSLEKISFLDACTLLTNGSYENNIPPHPPKKVLENNAKESAIQLNHVSSIRSKALINYLEKRRISLKLADFYTKEVHYSNQGKEYFAIGFRNDLGGYALRSEIFKGQLGSQYYTSILPHHETTTCNIFEGFFSMLSCLQHYQHYFFDNLTFVLNSVTANYNKLIPQIPEHIETINIFLDNDETGRKYLKKIQDLGIWTVKDCSKIYQNHKDFNEFLHKK